nr:GNAT family N-acetyltransferase [Sphingomonas aerophila]
MASPTDEQLRESAKHRGLKLLKSRRRKPGGDFGLYGLADSQGTPVFGSSDDGLTATAEDIAACLRRGDAATWASSVETTTDSIRPAKRPATEPEDDVEPAIGPRPRRRPTGGPAPVAKSRPKERQEPGPKPRAPSSPARADPAPSPPPAPPPARARPPLVVRPATRADADALSRLVPGTDAAAIAERIATATTLGEPVFVADEGGVIGCLAWHVMPTLQHGPIARVTFLAVASDQQRRGIGRRLIDHVADVAQTRDLAAIEVMSDITISSAHGFFRRLGFAQTSYRFARAPQADRSVTPDV